MDINEIVSLWCPIPPAIHPNWKTWERKTTEWIKKFQLESEQWSSGRLTHNAAGELAARTSLKPADERGGQLSADSLMWLFAFDDAYCDEGRYSDNPANMAVLVAELARIVETGHSRSKSPLARALADLRQRVDQLATFEQAARWTHAMRGYLSYQVWEAAYRNIGSVPTLDEYVVARIRNGSMEVCAMILDIAEGYIVPGAEIERADVRALTEIACSIVGWDNDIASYYKEHTRSVDKLNLVDVMANQLEVTADQALPQVVTLRDATLELFLRLQLQVASEVSAETRRYICGLASWIRGNLDWSLNTARYRRPDRASIAVREDLHNQLAPHRPPDGVSWWWRQLKPTETAV